MAYLSSLSIKDTLDEFDRSFADFAVARNTVFSPILAPTRSATSLGLHTKAQRVIGVEGRSGRLPMEWN